MRRVFTRRAFTAGLLAIGATESLGAQAALSASQQKGKQLIEDSITALGGQAFLNMQDRLEFGRAYQFYRERISGLAVARLYTRYPEPSNPLPDSYYGIFERQVFGKKQEDVVLFNSQGGFEVTFRGVRPLSDESVQKHRESTITNILYILRQRLQEPGISFAYNGVDVMENQQVEAVDVLDNQNRKLTVYLGVQTKFPVMQRYLRFDATYKERVEEITRFDKYRDAGSGVMWPHDIQRDRDGERVYQMFSDKVTVGSNFEAKLFDLPRDMKVLKKENF